MKRFRTKANLAAVTLSAIGLFAVSTAHGDVVVTISGVNGGTTFNWSISGSIVTNGSYTDASESNFTTGLTYPDDDNDNVVGIGSLARSGDTIVNSADSDIVSTGDVMLTINGGADLVGAFVIDVETTGGGRIDFDPAGTITIPATPGVATYAYSGSGVATLTAGTFDTVFSEGTATYTAAPNNSVIFNVIPEPTSLALLSVGGLLIARRRR